MTRADARHAQAESLLEQLKAQHPVLKHSRPLDEEIIEDALIAAHPEAEAWLLRLALHLHLNSDAYLQSLSHGGPRHDLADEPRGEVDSETRHHAHALLKHHRAHRTRGKA
jgi:ProP effector